MTRIVRHRGPDDEGMFIDGQIGLGHVRLSVIDPSQAGHQPMSVCEGAVAIVYNGEIYNFPALRNELISAGYHFRSHTDTEVILNGYLHWGLDVLNRLRGMFAFALWDGRTRKLILARDHIGKKPLSFAWCGDTLLFASEIKSILTWPGMNRTPNLEAIHHYLTLQYTPTPFTAFVGIEKLPMGHYAVFEAGRMVEMQAYWKLPPPTQARRRPFAELRSELVQHLNEAVRLRMISDVPLGAFLSGGVDSSAVVAIMAQASSNPVKTFCIGFEEEDFDERRYARIVAERYGTDHHEMVVRPNAAAVLPALVWHYNEPFADPSAIPTYYLSQLARQHVTVALNGDGGDENFLGYSRYRTCHHQRWVDFVPKSLRRHASGIAGLIGPSGDRYRVTRVLRRLLSQAGEMNSRRYAPSIAYFHDSSKQAGYGDAMREFLAMSSVDLLEPFFQQAPTYLAGAAWADIHTYLPDDLLVKVDVATMAHGLESRSPFLDQSFMAWAAGIPDDIKFNNGQPKALLKSAMESLLPHDILYRPKMGFGVPIERWLCCELRELFLDTMLSQVSLERGLFRREFIESQYDDHCSGRQLNHTRLWGMLMLELWFKMWIDPATSDQITAPTEDILQCIF